MRHWIIGGGLLAAALLLGGGALADDEDGHDALPGEQIAVEACSACHQVTARQVLPPPVMDPDERAQIPAPSFFEIAHTHGDDPGYLRNAILLPAHPMREQDWNDDDLKAVIAYIQSLRK